MSTVAPHLLGLPLTAMRMAVMRAVQVESALFPVADAGGGHWATAPRQGPPSRFADRTVRSLLRASYLYTDPKTGAAHMHPLGISAFKDEMRRRKRDAIRRERERRRVVALRDELRATRLRVAIEGASVSLRAKRHLASEAKDRAERAGLRPLGIVEASEAMLSPAFRDAVAQLRAQRDARQAQRDERRVARQERARQRYHGRKAARPAHEPPEDLILVDITAADVEFPLSRQVSTPRKATQAPQAIDTSDDPMLAQLREKAGVAP